MKTVIEFLSIFFISVASHLFGAYLHIKNPEYQKIYTVPQAIVRNWLHPVGIILVVILVALNQPNGVESIGIYSGSKSHNFNALYYGCMGGGVALLLITIIFNLKQVRRYLSKEGIAKIESDPANAQILIYRDFLERAAYLATVILMVIAEELVYRGYFVLYWGYKTNSLVIWILISLSLSVLIHLYQGRDFKSISLSILMHSVFIGLALIFQNILAPIAAHIWNNIRWVNAQWKEEKLIKVENRHSLLARIVYVIFIFINYSFFAFLLIFFTVLFSRSLFFSY